MMIDKTSLPELTVQKWKELDDVMQKGWIGVHAHMSQIPHTKEGMEELLAMLYAERSGHNRPNVIHRVYRCFAHARLKLEEAMLYGS